MHILQPQVLYWPLLYIFSYRSDHNYTEASGPHRSDCNHTGMTKARMYPLKQLELHGRHCNHTEGATMARRCCRKLSKPYGSHQNQTDHKPIATAQKWPQPHGRNTEVTETTRKEPQRQGTNLGSNRKCTEATATTWSNTEVTAITRKEPQWHRGNFGSNKNRTDVTATTWKELQRHVGILGSHRNSTEETATTRKESLEQGSNFGSYHKCTEVTATTWIQVQPHGCDHKGTKTIGTAQKWLQAHGRSYKGTEVTWKVMVTAQMWPKHMEVTRKWLQPHGRSQKGTEVTSEAIGSIQMWLQPHENNWNHTEVTAATQKLPQWHGSSTRSNCKHRNNHNDM